MKILTDPEKIKLKNTIVTLGKFDGNHIGHQLLFKTAIRMKEPGDSVVIFTFNVPPAAVVGQGDPESLRLIHSQAERTEQTYPEGVDYLVEFPFNEETRTMAPEKFVQDILVSRLGVKAVVVGLDFRFGKDRAGDIQTLKELGETCGFRVCPVEKVKYRLSGESEPKEVSSTLIKEEILKGNMEDVRAMLGCPFFMVGEVAHGKRLGRTIGFPTINFFVPDDKILPPNGVYATRVFIDGKAWDAITNVGNRPTFDDGLFRTVETNILDFQGDLYGRTLKVDFYKFIRPEKKYSSAEELKKEIEVNILEVKKYFHEC